MNSKRYKNLTKAEDHSASKSIKDLLAKEMANPDVPQLDTPRHTITVDDPAFRERLKKELKSCKPALEV